MVVIVGTVCNGAIRETASPEVEIAFPNDAAQPSRLRFQIHAEFFGEKLPSGLIVAEGTRSLTDRCQAPHNLAVGFLTQWV
jgi:hypothetical protein